MGSTTVHAVVARTPRRRWAHTSAVALASAAMAIGLGLQSEPAHALGTATPATTTVTVDVSLAGPLPVDQAMRAWTKGVPVAFVTGECSGSHCIRVLHQYPAVGEAVGPAIGGLAQPSADGSCSAYVEPWIDAYPAAQLAALEHELGHCLGLPHNTTDPKSVMAPVISLMRPPKGPDAQDRADLKATLS